MFLQTGPVSVEHMQKVLEHDEPKLAQFKQLKHPVLEQPMVHQNGPVNHKENNKRYCLTSGRKC